MEIVIHRVNKIEDLRELDRCFGAEIDVRVWGSKLILNHEPFKEGEFLHDYLQEYQHGLLVLNIKEVGIEDEVLRLVRQRNIPSYFLLDVEFPYIYRASRQGERAIAIRYSEDESIETVLKYKEKVDWVWIDTNTMLPLDEAITQQLEGFSTCLVCPERWGRPEDISTYRRQLSGIPYLPTAVMTSKACAQDWK